MKKSNSRKGRLESQGRWRQGAPAPRIGQISKDTLSLLEKHCCSATLEGGPLLRSPCDLPQDPNLIFAAFFSQSISAMAVQSFAACTGACASTGSSMRRARDPEAPPAGAFVWDVGQGEGAVVNLGWPLRGDGEELPEFRSMQGGLTATALVTWQPKVGS